MDNKTTYDNEKTEQLFRRDLHGYLTSIGQVDERLPEAPDLEELWPKLAQSYMPDGVRVYRLPHRLARVDDVYRHGRGEILG